MMMSWLSFIFPWRRRTIGSRPRAPTGAPVGPVAAGPESTNPATAAADVSDIPAIGFPHHAVLLALLLAGCTVGPDYRPPHPSIASSFSEMPQASKQRAASRPVSGGDVAQRWWTNFHDRELDQLVARAIAGNRDLQQAASRVRQARAERGLARAALQPTVDVTAGYSRARGSENVQLPFGQGGAGGATTGPTASAATRSQAGAQQAAPASPFGEGGFPGATTELYQAGFDASWELDVFGGGRRNLEAAVATVQAAEEGRRALLVTLLGEVARTYIELRSTQRRLAIARDNLGAQRELLDITNARRDAGLATDLDSARQQAQIATTTATIPALESAERVTTHALAILTGGPPDALDAELSSATELPALPPEVPVGVPSDLLRRRPDIRRAERELAAATAGIGVATADLFPHFSLTGALGVDSSEPGDLAQWSSRYYAIAPGLRWPLLDWGRVQARIRVENEKQQQALTNYEDTVMRALRDVEDALVRLEKEQARRSSLQDAVNASRHAFAIARDQRQQGLVDATVALDAQRSLLASEDALAQSDAAIRLDLIALYKALGGGWETAEPVP